MRRRRPGAGPQEAHVDDRAGTMVLLEAESLNSLFQTLTDWEHQLKALKADIPNELEGPSP